MDKNLVHLYIWEKIFNNENYQFGFFFINHQGIGNKDYELMNEIWDKFEKNLLIDLIFLKLNILKYLLSY